MKKKEMIAVISSRAARADHYFERIIKKFDIEDIHRFRVEMKKIRAFLKFVRMDAGNPDKLRVPGNIKRFYREVGILRTLQLQANLISKTLSGNDPSAPDAYLSMIRDKALKSMARAKRAGRKMESVKKEISSLHRRLPASMKPDAASRFIGSEFTILQDILRQPDPSEESLHMARKIMKGIFYDWSYLGPEALSALPSSMRSRAGVEKFTDLLGNFHDACVALSLVDRMGALRRTEEKERILMMNIRSEWQQERDEIRNQLVSDCETIIARPEEKKEKALPSLLRNGRNRARVKS